MILGERVKKLIEAHGYSINSMAKQIGIANTFMYKIVKMESVHTKYLEKIASALNIPIKVFFEEEAFAGDTSSMLSYIDDAKKESTELAQNFTLQETIDVLLKFIKKNEAEHINTKDQLEEIMKIVGPDFKKLEPYFDKKELEVLRSKLLDIRLRNPTVL